MQNDENIDSKTYRRARFIVATIYFLLLIAYLIVILVFIVRFPRCTPIGETIWWKNGVFLRFSSSTTKLDEISQRIDEFREKISPDAIWIPTVFPLSSKLNPIEWKTSNNENLTDFLSKLHQNNFRVLVDFPVNHLSIESSKFIENDRNYFIWNDRGNESNWNSSWIFSNRTNSFYLSQFNDPDAIDVNFRNNRVLNEFLDALTQFRTKINFDGLNLQGISYAYEDFEFRNQSEGLTDRTRHLEEDFFLLHRIRKEFSSDKILLLDRIDSLATSNENLLKKYFSDIQMATVDDFLVDSGETNVAELFDRYDKSIFYSNFLPIIWTSNSIDTKLAEAFFAAAFFHFGAISIDSERFHPSELVRLGQLTNFLRKLDVFRDGKIQQKFYPETNWLKIERSRRGSRHYAIIINFNRNDGEQHIELTEGIRNAVEVVFSNIENPSTRYENNALIDMTKPIALKSFEFLIIRWSPKIDGLGILF